MDAITVFERTVRRFPDRTFLFDGRSEVTWAEAAERADGIAAELEQRGLEPGQTLGLCSPDSVPLVLAILGAWKAGLLPGLVDPRTSEADLPYFVEDVGAKVLLATTELGDRLRAAGANEVLDLAEFGAAGGASFAGVHGPEAPLYLSYTSGTTGAPKGAILLSSPVTLGTACIADRLRLGHEDVLLATTPTASSFQLVAALLPAIHSGAAIGLVAGRPASELWGIARARGATVLVAYPLTLGDMIDAREAGEGPPPFRMALSGGSPLAPRLKREYRAIGAPMCESYGQSELGGFMALGRPDDDERTLAGAVGTPLPDRPAIVIRPDGTECHPGDVGEIAVPWGFFAGYANKDAAYRAATAGGMLHCGDLGTADADGFLRVLGRTNELEAARARGGFLREAEDALYEHPATRHGVVVQMRDGEVEAFVEARAGHSVDGRELDDFLGDRLAPGLRPRLTTVVEAMPRTFSGKANRLLLASGGGAG
jgi:long-chain acyl-CoA synthetase